MVNERALRDFKQTLTRLQAHGYSLTELERRLGLSTGYLSKLKAGRATPSNQLAALVSVLDAVPEAAAHLLGNRAVHSTRAAPPSAKTRRQRREPSDAGLAALLRLAPRLTEQRIPWALAGAPALEALGVDVLAAHVDIYLPEEERRVLALFRDSGMAVTRFADDHFAAFPKNARTSERVDIRFAELGFLREALSERRSVLLRGVPVAVLPPVVLATLMIMSKREAEHAAAVKLLESGHVDPRELKRELNRLRRSRVTSDWWRWHGLDPSLGLSRLAEGS